METELETPPGGRITDGPAEGTIVRTFAAEFAPGDGRTVDVRIVPYGEQITHNDGHGGVPKGVAYQEEFVAGVFSHQVNAANRVLANFEHQPGLGGVVGHGLTLRESSDGFYGSFRIHETPDGDKALTLIREKVLEGVSVEAKPVRSERTSAGVVRRVKAHMFAIAFTRFGAYENARVLALREEADLIVDEEILPVDMDPELVERCRRLGIALPQRYETHPAGTGTPVDAGTPEAAPVVDESQPTSEGTQ